MDNCCLVAINAVGLPVHRRTPSPQSSQRLVHGDARDPCAEGSIPAKHIETGKGADISLLHHVLGFSVIAQDAPRNAEQTAIISLCDRSNRGFVASSRQTHQIRIAERFGYGLLGLRHWHRQCPPFRRVRCIRREKVPGAISLKTTPPARRPFSPVWQARVTWRPA